jgi:hypothetical protein
VPDFRVNFEDKCNLKACLRKDKDTLDSALTNRENITANPDLPPQSPSPLSITDVVIADLSRRSLDVEHTGDRPTLPLHGQYDIVYHIPLTQLTRSLR